ncbi:MAG: type III pantothenate kinase [Planctomycetota bacterium]
MNDTPCSNPFPLVAADVGNHRIKLGLFEAKPEGNRHEPGCWLAIADEEPQLDRIAEWLSDRGREGLSWWIASVNRPGATRVVDWLRSSRPKDRITLLAAGDLPLAVSVERPDMVGIDRLLDAVAANHFRDPARPAIIVDLGSAITVDLVSAEGAFLGGVIMPGIAMSARALHEFTDLLPRIEMSELTTPPPPLGASTVPAMRSGLFWGAVGAIRQLIDLLGDQVSGEPDVFLSGGAGPAVAGLLGRSVRHVPHLTLAGITLTAQAQRET